MNRATSSPTKKKAIVAFLESHSSKAGMRAPWQCLRITEPNSTTFAQSSKRTRGRYNKGEEFEAGGAGEYRRQVRGGKRHGESRALVNADGTPEEYIFRRRLPQGVRASGQSYGRSSPTGKAFGAASHLGKT
jgi:hypothetical protein